MNLNDPLALELILTEALVRITAIERILISKGIIDEQEFQSEIKNISKSLIDAIKNQCDIENAYNNLTNIKDKN